MFKSLLAVLDTARAIVGSEQSLLRETFNPLARIDASLAARATAFVANGSDEAVLLALRAHAPQAGTLLGKPGRLWAYYASSQDEDERKAIEASTKARDNLYRKLEASAANAAVLVRLGKVFESADQLQQLDRPGSAAPDWLQYLLNDALRGTHGRSASDDEMKRRPAWDILLLNSILAEAGLPEAMALSIVFERKSTPSYWGNDTYRRLLAPGPLDDHMLAHPDDVAFTARTLSASGKAMFCERLGASDTLLSRYGELIAQLAVDDSRTVRAVAARHLDKLEPGVRTALLTALLRAGKNEQRINAAELVARLQGAQAESVLAAALNDEKSKPVREVLQSALSRLQAAKDASAVDLPEPPPLPPFDETVLAEDAIDLLLENRTQLLEKLRKGAQDEIERNRTAKYKTDYGRKRYDSYTTLTERQLRDAVRALNGEQDAFPLLQNDNVYATLAFNNRLESRADHGLLQVFRLRFNSGRGGWDVWRQPDFQRWLQRQEPSQVDLRQLAELAVRCGGEADEFALSCLCSFYGASMAPQNMLPPDRVWPHLAMHPGLIDEGLGMAPASPQSRIDVAQTLSALGIFPVVPARWLPRVMEFALGDGKTHRPAAQHVLERLPDIGERVSEALQSSKQELRIEAARWLARLGHQAAIPALLAALGKETRETVSAELMTALEKLGEDMSARLAPDMLLKQARKGLKAKPPAGLAWLNLELLPACRWTGGEQVEPDIIRWWVILACKLKEPAANAMLVRYMDLLDKASREALGRFLLFQFIAHDTAHPPLEEAAAWATQQAPASYQQNQALAKKYPQYYGEQGKLTLEQVAEQLKRSKLGEYLGSAIGEKGILALTFATPAHEFVAALQQYMRDHYPRRAQVEAMLEAACVSDEAAMIQFVLGIARRYRTASVQQKARVLVERIAERNGWSADQLADRTIPTGGLDETGCLLLQYGAREYSVTLDAGLKIVLRNSEGKTVSALPAPRQDDAAASITEAKQLLSTCKKELKQVLAMQTARLYEAMCTGRTWPAADWHDYLRRHPVAGRLVQRLVWVELDPASDSRRLFRPTEDGSLVDANDDDVAIAAGAQVGLAHASTLDAAEVKAWQAHLKDYKVAPLFAQLSRHAPPAFGPAADEIGDRLGWTSDAFTLRGAFAKLGYQRGQAEDGGVFFEYVKDFTSIGMRVSIEFSGNALPEENVPAALKRLAFQHTTSGSHFAPSIPLRDVPPVLLAEAYADYHTVAAACHFDPEWERKMPW
jgi:hypothetical protein